MAFGLRAKGSRKGLWSLTLPLALVFAMPNLLASRVLSLCLIRHVAQWLKPPGKLLVNPLPDLNLWFRTRVRGKHDVHLSIVYAFVTSTPLCELSMHSHSQPMCCLSTWSSVDKVASGDHLLTILAQSIMLSCWTTPSQKQ